MRVGIIGLGLIGGSLAAGLVREGYEVTGYDSNPEAMRLAFDGAFLSERPDSQAHAIDADLVMLCMPMGSIAASVADIGPRMRPGSILADVASVKKPVIEAMDKLDGHVRCIGGHPMAGKAVGGIRNADPELFRHRPFALIETNSTDSASWETLVTLVEALGARPVKLDADAHDAEVARTSHVPQLISSALSLFEAETPNAQLKGPALESMLRLAASDEELWSDIFTANRVAVCEAADGYINQLETLRDAVASGEREQIVSVMRQARESRA